jgi:hypothetical protein
VTNANDEAVLDADVVVVGIGHNVTTSNKGEYWRLLLPGEYEMYATAYGYRPSDLVKVVVEAGRTAVRNFTLQRTPPEKDSRSTSSISSSFSLFYLVAVSSVSTLSL